MNFFVVFLCMNSKNSKGYNYYITFVKFFMNFKVKSENIVIISLLSRLFIDFGKIFRIVGP